MDALPVTSADLDEFRAAWSQIDPAATGMISGNEVPRLLAALPRHLGFDELAGEDEISLRELRLPDLPDGSKGGYMTGTPLDEKAKKSTLRSLKSVGKLRSSKPGAAGNDAGRVQVLNPLTETSLDEKTKKGVFRSHKSVGKRNDSTDGAADKASGRIQVVNPLLADLRNSADSEQGDSTSKDSMLLSSSESHPNLSMMVSFDQRREEQLGYNFFGARIILNIQLCARHEMLSSLTVSLLVFCRAAQSFCTGWSTASAACPSLPRTRFAAPSACRCASGFQGSATRHCSRRGKRGLPELPVLTGRPCHRTSQRTWNEFMLAST